MEEANEKLVKLYLESKGFFVRMNEKFKAEKNRKLEIDIIAIRPKKRNDGLPDKIVGEVKSWSPRLLHMSNNNIEEKNKKHQGKFKAVFEDREKTEKYIKDKYGSDFKFYIFSRKLPIKEEDKILKTLKELKTNFIDLEFISEKIKEHALSQSYTNDPELQLIRILDRKSIEKLKEW
ncbi:MAG: hypothetical protein ABIH25_00385 [Candidatus Woesearchaeota archaeon]